MKAPVYEIKEVFEIEDKTPVRYRRLRFIVGHEGKTCFMFPQYMFKNNMRLACKNMCSKNKCKAAISVKLIDEIQNVKVDKPHAYELPPSVSSDLLKKTSTYSVISHKVSTLKFACTFEVEFMTPFNVPFSTRESANLIRRAWPKVPVT